MVEELSNWYTDPLLYGIRGHLARRHRSDMADERRRIRLLAMAELHQTVVTLGIVGTGP